jgi:hypothetical protein
MEETEKKHEGRVSENRSCIFRTAKKCIYVFNFMLNTCFNFALQTSTAR